MKCPVCKERVTLSENGKEGELGNVVQIVCPKCGARFEFQAMKKMPIGIAGLVIAQTLIYVSINSPYNTVGAVLVLGAFLYWLFRWENIQPQGENKL